METGKNYLEKWGAIKNEMNAHVEKLDAERRLKYNDVMENFDREVEASSDWAEAQWDEFKARVKRQWNEIQISANESSDK